MHDTYTILHLTPWTRAGLVCLSAVLALATVAGAHWLHRGARLRFRGAGRAAVHGLVAAGVFWLFLWLNPQVYYLFYWLALAGLPMQLVIAAPPPLNEVLGLLMIDFTADLPPIAQGLLGWTLALQAVWQATRKVPGEPYGGHPSGTVDGKTRR